LRQTSLTRKAGGCYILGRRADLKIDTAGFSTQEGHDMRKIACLLLLVGTGFGLGGCATPAYTGGENVSRVLRTWDFEHKQMIEEIMYETMIEPPSRSTVWNLR
jgi:hypothetical protein